MTRPLRTLVVGLDSACWEYVEPLLARGEMPALARLLAQGSSRTLESTMPPWTPVAWASLVTGKNPGKHGVLDMVAGEPPRPVGSGDRSGTPLWRWLNEAGVSTGLVNVPFDHPPGPIDGFALCGLGAPAAAPDLATPPELGEWLRDCCGGWEPSVAPEALAEASPAETYALEREHQGRQVELACALQQRRPVDVLVTNLLLPDHANHQLADFAAVERAYRDTDADLEVLLDELEPRNVVLLSDHGSTRARGVFHLGEWLRDGGWLVRERRGRKGRRDALNSLLVRRATAQGATSGAAEKLRRRLRLWRLLLGVDPVAGLE
ncbi:MAG: alkaline phosphatase family protein, partial [Thermoanaerobaculia bacterium]|nr:alkaline phosphatase family protein [Thermoanaerobaculia bacterium]